ncbi:diguanylate cyclase (GGDEF) domain-containing protein [Nitrosomonas aestuarii]|uniref:Diguanylate cyclase (GGDEF) domain-containing protein n=1 Tax=Nitrosomonas aestuarii TaxID=52441 RepID=A0A1I4BVH8_9PROT|nr:EAL domain-containing protein [Nitrosomonas aestuarii]SFK72069.1 diguanylate cyclase (GGDEF) domain-containing protein [Nitrosomonas aestuarii]
MDKCIKILIVEDEQIVAFDLKKRLIRLGYQVTGTAASGNKALALIDEELPSIVLMDIHIQGSIDGIEVATRLQETYHIPVIYLTAYSEENTLSRARATQPYGYLLKPFSDRELHVMIQVSMERYETDAQLKKSEQHFRLALEAARLGTWEKTKHSNEVFLGKSPNGYIESIPNWEEFFDLIHKRDKQKVSAFIERMHGEPNVAEEIEFCVSPVSGEDRWYKLYGKSFAANKLYEHQIIGVLQETTENRRVQNKLEQAAIVFECAAEGIVILRNKMFDCANKAFYKMTQFHESDLKNSELPFMNDRFLSKETYHEIWQSVEENGHWQGEIMAFKENKAKMYALLNVSRVPVKECGESQSVVIISDITAMRETQEQLLRIAYYDNLTNLPNRMLVMDRLKQEITKAKRDATLVGVLFIDLDNFKMVNDTLGHKAGDTMLHLISQRMLSILRESDTLGRLGGDEFIVIAANTDTSDGFVRIANKILKCLSDPIVVNNMEIVPSCSIGISVYPDHSDHQDGLVQMADTAMYKAKGSGRNSYAFYHPSLTQNAVHHLTREHELYLALERNELQLYYQPKFSSLERRLTGVEALIRWQHPVKGLLSPVEIIPIAERSRLIITIGNWVLTEACRQLFQWRSEGLCDLGVAVNISIRQFSDTQLPKLIAKLMHRYDLPSHLLELEITESCLQNELTNNASLQELEKLGVSISIDDFGTGYSCMSSLKNLPIHKLKIDHSFIKDIPLDRNDCAIAAAILALSKELNLKVVAEGIEKSEQIAFLDDHGCDELQGYLLGKPVPADQIPGLIKKSAFH